MRIRPVEKVFSIMPALAIPNLLYRYADYIDSGRFEAAAQLFQHGRIIVGSRVIESQEEMVAFWRKVVKVHECGTPKTRHLITNPQIELTDAGSGATCQSQWTVVQALPGFPLQVIATGRYSDRFIRREGSWYFEERAYLPIDLEGDLSRHLNVDPRRAT